MSNKSIIIFIILGFVYLYAFIALTQTAFYVLWDKAYVVISEDGKTITFYHDARILFRRGTKHKYNKWCNLYNRQPLIPNITKAVFDQSFKDARPTTCMYLFNDCPDLSTIEGIENLNTSEVKNMHSMFHGCSRLTTLDVSGFDTKKVENMSCMFSGCKNLTQLDLSSFDTKEVRDMSCMFSHCKKLTQLDLSNFNSVEVSDMHEMFRGCSSLTTLDIEGLNPTSCAQTSRMFFGCSKLKQIFANNSWEKMDVHGLHFEENTFEMFYGCDSLYGGQGTECVPLKDNGKYAHIDGGPHFPGYFTSKGPKPFDTECSTSERQPYAVLENDVLTFRYDNQKPENAFGIGKFSMPWHELAGNFTKVIFEKSFADYKPYLLRYMFKDCSQLTEISGLENLNTSETVDMCEMFYGCSSLTKLDLSGFNTANVSNMYQMFYDCSSLTSLDVSSFNTEKVESMYKMFYNCSSLTSLDVSHFNTKNVTDMTYTFCNCSSLKELDVSHFDTQNVTSMGGMFEGCESLEYLDVSGFNTFNVDNMSAMFQRCKSLKNLDVSGFNTEKVDNMTCMFEGCRSLTEIDVSRFNTAKVYYMRGMFANCSSLTSLDLSSFNTGYAFRMDRLFEYCTKLETIYTNGDWSAENVDNAFGMFYDCKSLRGGKGTRYDPYNYYIDYARIDGGKSKPGYFTKKQ